MLPMTWLLIFQDLWELEEVRIHWNVNQRTSPNIHTKDRRMRDTMSRLDSAKELRVFCWLLVFSTLLS